METVSAFRPEDVVHGCSGEREIPGPAQLRVAWNCEDEGTAARVRLWLQGRSDPRTEFRLDAGHPSQEVRLGDANQGAKGIVWLSLGRRTAQLCADLQTGPGSVYDGAISEWALQPEPPPPPPPGGSAPGNAGVVLASLSAPRDIFPFLVTGTPRPGGEAVLEGRLVVCPKPSTLPLYVTLSGLRSGEGAVAAMREAAATFQGGTEYVRDLALLPDPFPRLPTLWRRLWALEGAVTLEALEALSTEVLGMTPQAFFALPDTQATVDRLWQSVFALAWVGVPGLGSTGAADSLVLGLRTMAWLARLVAGDPGLTAEPGRHAALEAFVVLPEGVTPPPATSTGAGGFSELLGPGRLEVVRQRLVRYGLGDVAFTVNVMPRERRVLTDRSLSRADTAEREVSSTRDEQRRDSVSDGRSELQDELSDLVASASICRDWNASRTYGTDGLSWTDTGHGTGTDCTPEREQRLAAAFAQGLTSLASSRIGRRVGEDRVRRLREEHERVSRVELDNLQGTSRQVGLYRWLNKVFELSLEWRGRRLVAELMELAPAVPWIHTLEQSAGAPLEAPTPLSALSPAITGPGDITADNYLTLAARYGVSDLPPPPERTRVVRATFQRQPPATSAELELPEGYVPDSVRVSWIIGDGRFGLAGYVGDFLFDATPTPPPTEAAAARPAASEAAPTDDTGCPACTAPPPLAPPSVVKGSVTGTATDLGAVTGRVPVSVLCAATSFAVSVALPCTRARYDEDLAAWQWRTYDTLVEGYDAQLRAYREALAARIRASSQGRQREVELEQLKAGGMSLLWARHTVQDADEPACLRFLDRIFEWPEMAYRFYPWGPGTSPEPARGWAGEALLHPGSDALFLRFLTAGSARVLLPVVPGREPDALFYFLFGALPPWETASAPVAAQDLPWLASMLAPPEPIPDDARWLEEVPTSLVVLQDGPALPEVAS